MKNKALNPLQASVNFNISKWAWTALKQCQAYDRQQARACLPDALMVLVGNAGQLTGAQLLHKVVDGYEVQLVGLDPKP